MDRILQDWNRSVAHGEDVPAEQGETRREPAKPPLWIDDDAWDEAAIPVRPWVVPGYLMRGAVTLIAGPGGAGKSSLMVAWSIALALGQPFGRFTPNHACTVLNYNVEDDGAEQRRRMSAALRPANAHPAAIRGKVIRCGPNTVGTLLEREMLSGSMVNTDALESLRSIIAARRPDVLFLDPLVELHTAEENDNTALRLVIAHLREIARSFDIAVALIHHTRKGGTAGDADAIRGGSAIVGAVRVALTVMSMTEGECEELGLPESQRASFFRVDSAKGNYAPPRAAAWHELVEYELDNGEKIAAACPWEAPVGPTGPAPEEMARIEAALEKGIQGQPYSARLALDQPRSIGALLASMGISAKPAQQRVIRALQGKGWTTQTFRDRFRKPLNGLRSPNGLPHCNWQDGGADGED